MCDWGNTKVLDVTIPASHSHTGKAYKKKCGIDKCIYSLVKALNDRGIATVASCCGHGKIPGNIALFDGRYIEIYSNWEEYATDFCITFLYLGLSLAIKKFKVFNSKPRKIKKIIIK